jgi:hypothetical protein
LRGMKFDKRAFIDEEKNKPRKPSQHIAEKPSHVFVYTGGGW